MEMNLDIPGLGDMKKNYYYCHRCRQWIPKGVTHVCFGHSLDFGKIKTEVKKLSAGIDELWRFRR
jgi:hypothetical protein